MLVIGILAVFALCNPVKNIAITYGISILLILRVIQRFFFAQQALQHFEIPVAWYWAQTIFFLATACVLLWLRPKESSSA